MNADKSTIQKEETRTENGIQKVEVVREIERREADIDPLLIIEQRNKLLERILAYAIAATHAEQWTSLDGKPFPTAAAAEVMARRCAVSIKNVRSEKRASTDDKGAFYIYVVTGTCSLPGEYDAIEAMGTCSSRDTFLGTETRAGRAMSEIDEGNIAKAAYSNFIVNGVTRLLGVRNLTWEQLERLGIKQDGAAKVEYRNGSRGGGQTATKDGAAVVPFGRDKGKTLPELDPDGLNWHLKTARAKVAENDSKWGEKNKAWLVQLETEQARRANEANGQTAPTPKANPWTRITALLTGAGVPRDVWGELVKRATKKANAKDLAEDDVAKVKAALDEQAAAAAGDDIRF